MTVPTATATGGVIPRATLVALNVETGVKISAQTNTQGFYSFPALSVGHYNIQIQAKDFSEYRQTGVVLDVNTALHVDATLQVGKTTQQFEVSAATVQVDTVSTQMGEVIGSNKMTSLPLDGRSYTDLLALQPGVAPSNSGYGDLSYVPSSPSGGLNASYLSISGQREDPNGFMVNGGSVEERLIMAPASSLTSTPLPNSGS